MNILKELMESMDNMGKEVGNFSRETETIKKRDENIRSEKYNKRRIHLLELAVDQTEQRSSMNLKTLL